MSKTLRQIESNCFSRCFCVPNIRGFVYRGDHSESVSDLVFQLRTVNISDFVLRREPEEWSVFFTLDTGENMPDEGVSSLVSDSLSRMNPTPMAKLCLEGYFGSSISSMYDFVYGKVSSRGLSILAQAMAGCRMTLLIDGDQYDDCRELCEEIKSSNVGNVLVNQAIANNTPKLDGHRIEPEDS